MPHWHQPGPQKIILSLTLFREPNAQKSDWLIICHPPLGTWYNNPLQNVLIIYLPPNKSSIFIPINIRYFEKLVDCSSTKTNPFSSNKNLPIVMFRSISIKFSNNRNDSRLWLITKFISFSCPKIVLYRRPINPRYT